MLKKLVKSVTPPVVADVARLILPSRPSVPVPLQEGNPEIADVEYVDFWGNTSMFALEVLQNHGPLRDMKLLSLGNKMAHLADYLALFGRVYHNTMLTTALPVAVDRQPHDIVLLQEDFFGLPALPVDCVISHAAIHCLNDTRYGNPGSESGWQRPYQAAAKIREIIGNGKVPVIASIAVHQSESFIDDNARLDHDKFVTSFAKAGFSLQDHFFDYLCYGMPFQKKYLTVEYRRSKLLPTVEEAPGDYHYVIGNYYFL